MRVFQQLWHGGHHIHGLAGRLPWAPADVPSPFSGLVGVPMGTAEIGEVVESFGTAARMCRDAGLDGVEIHAGHGYLIQQFLSPLTNTRDDEYGGSLQNRMRFALEVFRAVRRAVGADFPVGARLSTSTAPGNVSAAELGQLARTLQDEDLISFLDASHGDYYQMDRMTATMAEVAGYELEPNAPLLASVSVPAWSRDGSGHWMRPRASCVNAVPTSCRWSARRLPTLSSCARRGKDVSMRSGPASPATRAVSVACCRPVAWAVRLIRLPVRRVF
jgi:2,4-dienoyl-CoA reductase-like NADH-dependent reductase (Old Yellow Enzyme family)